MSKWPLQHGCIRDQIGVHRVCSHPGALFACRGFESEKRISANRYRKQEPAYEIVSVLKIASHSHLASAVSAMHTPFTPVERVYAPGCKIVAVGSHTVAVVEEGSSAHGLLIHTRVCTRSDIGKAKRRAGCGARGGRREILLGRRASSILGVLGRIGERNVFLLGTQASGARPRIGV